MHHPIVAKISPSGSTTLVYHPDTQQAEAAAFSAALGTVKAEQRGAYVLPLPRGKRRVFQVLRRVFGGAGWIAAWTRRWRGPWVVVLPGAHVRLPGEFATHAEAVQAEVAWILEHKG